jgi:hypothetical protein
LTSRCYYAAGTISRYVPERLLCLQHRKRKSKKRMPMYQKKKKTEENKKQTNHLLSPRRKRRPVGKKLVDACHQGLERSVTLSPFSSHRILISLRPRKTAETRLQQKKMARSLPRYRCATDSYWSTSSTSLLSVHGTQINIGKKQNSVSFRSRSIKVKRCTPHANTYTE